MSIFANISLKTIESVIFALNNDAQLSNIISGAYVQPPENAPTPYLIMRPPLLQNRSSAGINIAELLVAIDIFSTSKGVIEAHNIAIRIHYVMNNLLNLAPHKLLDTRFIEQQFNLERRGELRQSQIKFRMMIEE